MNQTLNGLTDEQSEKIMLDMVSRYGEILYCYSEHYPKIFKQYLELYKQFKELKNENIL